MTNLGGVFCITAVKCCFFNGLDRNHDMRDILGTSKSIEVMKEVCQTLKERVQVFKCTLFCQQFSNLTMLLQKFDSIFS